jgi:type IV pilus assembly protein PilM
MGFLPKTMGTRPRLACEVRAEGVVAARADDSAAVLSAVERVSFEGRTATANNPASALARTEKIAAVKRALDAVGPRGREVTLVVPDTAARVLLIDFDELPAKMAEALPVVRFRLKKLLPFDADDAAVSYQIMAQTRSMTQVLAVAMPREALAEYEAMVREAGYEPGAVLPSTLAALAGLDENERASLVVNAGREAVTTAIVRGGILLLHRTIDLTTGDPSAGVSGGAVTAVLPDVTRSADAPSAGGAAGAALGTDDAARESSREASRESTIAAIAARFAAMEGQTTPAPRAPEAPAISRVGSALASGMVQSSTSSETANVTSAATAASSAQRAVAPAEEIAQAVNVAAAYFEDTLGAPPQVILSAGTLGAEALARLLGGTSLRAEEMVSGTMSGANGSVPAGWLAGVRGALRS